MQDRDEFVESLWATLPVLSRLHELAALGEPEVKIESLPLVSPSNWLDAVLTG